MTSDGSGKLFSVHTTECARCQQSLRGPVASISGSIMGDEESESWFWCEVCSTYTRTRSRDRFHGDETVRRGEAVSQEEGARWIAIIDRCSEAGDKRCRCDAHREYFGPWLD